MGFGSTVLAAIHVQVKWRNHRQKTAWSTYSLPTREPQGIRPHQRSERNVTHRGEEQKPSFRGSGFSAALSYRFKETAKHKRESRQQEQVSAENPSLLRQAGRDNKFPQQRSDAIVTSRPAHLSLGFCWAPWGSELWQGFALSVLTTGEGLPPWARRSPASQHRRQRQRPSTVVERNQWARCVFKSAMFL